MIAMIAPFALARVMARRALGPESRLSGRLERSEVRSNCYLVQPPIFNELLQPYQYESSVRQSDVHLENHQSNSRTVPRRYPFCRLDIIYRLSLEGQLYQAKQSFVPLAGVRCFIMETLVSLVCSAMTSCSFSPLATAPARRLTRRQAG